MTEAKGALRETPLRWDVPLRLRERQRQRVWASLAPILIRLFVCTVAACFAYGGLLLAIDERPTTSEWLTAVVVLGFIGRRSKSAGSMRLYLTVILICGATIDFLYFWTDIGLSLKQATVFLALQ